MNAREVANAEIAPIRDAIQHALSQVPTAAGLVTIVSGGLEERDTILATCEDGTVIAIEISIL